MMSGAQASTLGDGGQACVGMAEEQDRRLTLWSITLALGCLSPNFVYVKEI